MRRITKERENDKYIAAESRHFLACPTFGRVTCERLHFLVQDHRNSFDSRSQSSRKGALHGIISQVGSNVPLVVRLVKILSSIKRLHFSWTSTQSSRLPRGPSTTSRMFHRHVCEATMKKCDGLMFFSKMQTSKSNMLHRPKKWGPLWTKHGTGWTAQSAESWCPRNGTLTQTLGRLRQNKVHKSWKKRFNQNFAHKTMPSDTK